MVKCQSSLDFCLLLASVIYVSVSLCTCVCVCVCVCVGLRKESSYNKIWIRLLATTLWNWKKILLTFWLVVLIELGCYLFVTLALRQYFEKAEAG